VAAALALPTSEACVATLSCPRQSAAAIALALALATRFRIAPDAKLDAIVRPCFLGQPGLRCLSIL